MKMQHLIFTFSLSSILFLWSCDEPKHYPFGVFPDEPVNFTEINTEYDDYNSDIPFYGDSFPLCYSSNSKSAGTHFDIVYKMISVQYSKTEGELRIFNETSANLDVVNHYAVIYRALNRINTTADELGPNMLVNWDELMSFQPAVCLLYSTNNSGNQQIMFTHNLSNDYFTEPGEIPYLNSDWDDAYPTLLQDYSGILFCSNREGNFDFYTTHTHYNHDLISMLSDTTEHQIRKETQLSSAADDKCPMVMEDLLVFTSDREGGYGGFDLYYSKRVDSTWTEPINFGPSINTAYDEYRPYVRREWQFSTDLMFFSSNRPGGKGGFDLYYVGIQR